MAASSLTAKAHTSGSSSSAENSPPCKPESSPLRRLRSRILRSASLASSSSHTALMMVDTYSSYCMVGRKPSPSMASASSGMGLEAAPAVNESMNSLDHTEPASRLTLWMILVKIVRCLAIWAPVLEASLLGKHFIRLTAARN